jgi:hypothetical protein
MEPQTPRSRPAQLDGRLGSHVARRLLRNGPTGGVHGQPDRHNLQPRSPAPEHHLLLRIDQRGPNGVTTGEVWSFSTSPQPSGVTFLGAAAPVASSGPINPALPSGLRPGDILILFLQTADARIYLEDKNGGIWRSLARNVASPQSVGTGNDKVHITAYYSRYNGHQGAPTTNDSGSHQLGVILAFCGVVAQGVPWDTADGNRRGDVDTNGFTPGATTSVPNTLIVGAVATALTRADGFHNFSGWRISSGMTQVTERVDVSTSLGITPFTRPNRGSGRSKTGFQDTPLPCTGRRGGLRVECRHVGRVAGWAGWMDGWMGGCQGLAGRLRHCSRSSKRRCVRLSGGSDWSSDWMRSRCCGPSCCIISRHWS